MDIMTDTWSVFGIDQGQMVERAYRYDIDRSEIIFREIDRSIDSVSYWAADDPDSDETGVDLVWNGSEIYPPWEVEGVKLEWRELNGNPFNDQA